LENYKTIKELADELNVSKQTIQYHYQRLNKDLICKNSSGINLVSKKAEKIIVSKVNVKHKPNVTKDQQTGSKEQTKTDKEEKADITILEGEKEMLFETYQDIISDKDRQIATKDQQINKLSNLLDQQQQLTLQSNKQIEQLQNQLMLLAPQNEKAETEAGGSDSETQNVSEEELQVESVEEDRDEKKWWQFWK